MVHTCRALTVAWVIASLLASCGGRGGGPAGQLDAAAWPDTPVAPDAVAGADAHGHADVAPPDCDVGHLPGPLAGCMPIGPSPCAPLFVDDEGLCRPSVDACPTGTIPRFDTGCVPVGAPSRPGN